MAKKEKKEEQFSLKREIMEWVLVIITAFLFAFILDFFIIVNAVVPSASMEPTIMTKSRVIGFRLAYINDDPVRGDIVIFKYPDNEKELFIKRIIGEPGDTINIVDGLVYINDSSAPLDEPYLAEEPIGSFGPYVVPDGAYFMMGDNRNCSADSRFWNQPYVYKEKILGKALFKYFPGIEKIQ